MVELIGVLTLFSSIIFIGFLSEVMFKKTRIPDVIILMLIGVLIANVLGFDPSVLGLGATVFINLALILLLFQGAINLDFRTLFVSLRSSTVIALLSFIATSIIIALLAMQFFGFEFTLALLMGMALGGTSSAVVIPMVTNLPTNKKVTSVLTIESALSDVFGIIGALSIIGVMTAGQFSSEGIVSNLISSFSIALLLGGAAGFAWLLLLKKNKTLASAEMVTIAFTILVFAIIESAWIGASGAIGVLAFGLILGNAKPILSAIHLRKKGEEPFPSHVMTPTSRNFFGEVSFFVKVFFFVYLGMLIDFSNPIVFGYAGLLCLAVYLVRPFIVKLVFFKEKLSNIDKTALQVLIPKGLAAAVIAQIAVEKMVPGAEKIVNPIIATVFVSILLTAILIFLNGRNCYNGIPFLWKSKGK